MKSFYRREYINIGQSVKVICSKPAIVMVMTDAGYEEYQEGHGLRFYGGYFTNFPTIVSVPNSGYWNIVIAQYPYISKNISCHIGYFDS